MLVVCLGFFSLLKWGRSRKTASGPPEGPELPPCGLRPPPQDGGTAPQGAERRRGVRGPSPARRPCRVLTGFPGKAASPSAGFGFSLGKAAGGRPRAAAALGAPGRSAAGECRGRVAPGGGEVEASCWGTPRGFRFGRGWGSGCTLPRVQV